MSFTCWFSRFVTANSNVLYSLELKKSHITWFQTNSAKNGWMPVHCMKESKITNKSSQQCVKESKITKKSS